MAKKNVKLPKGAIKKLAKAYSQLEQRRRQEEAILALGPSLLLLHEEKKRKRRRRSPSPVYRRTPPAYSRYIRAVGPRRPEDAGVQPMEMDVYRAAGYKRRHEEIDDADY